MKPPGYDLHHAKSSKAWFYWISTQFSALSSNNLDFLDKDSGAWWSPVTFKAKELKMAKPGFKSGTSDSKTQAFNHWACCFLLWKEWRETPTERGNAWRVRNFFFWHGRICAMRKRSWEQKVLGGGSGRAEEYASFARGKKLFSSKKKKKNAKFTLWPKCLIPAWRCCDIPQCRNRHHRHQS